MTTQTSPFPLPTPGEHPLLTLTWSDDGSVGFHAHWAVAVAVVTVLVGFVVWRLWAGREAFRDIFVEESEIHVGPAKFTLKPDYHDRQLAFAIWSELATRRASLPFDENSILVEIYDSLYELFSRTRELLKTIPVERLDRQSTRSIVEATVSLLNDGMRPHMTRWGTHFRSWYGQEMERAKAEQHWIAVHELQMKFPGYHDLIADYKITNSKLIDYRNQLYRLATGSNPTKYPL